MRIHIYILTLHGDPSLSVLIFLLLTEGVYEIHREKNVRLIYLKIVLGVSILFV